MDTRFELVREELRLRREIAARELACLMEDGAAGDVIDAKIEECELIMARQEHLERWIDRLAAG